MTKIIKWEGFFGVVFVLLFARKSRLLLHKFCHKLLHCGQARNRRKNKRESWEMLENWQSKQTFWTHWPFLCFLYSSILFNFHTRDVHSKVKGLVYILPSSSPLFLFFCFPSPPQYSLQINSSARVLRSKFTQVNKEQFPQVKITKHFCKLLQISNKQKPPKQRNLRKNGTQNLNQESEEFL